MSTSMQGRIDICSFATVVKGYADRGLQPKTKSDMLWRIVEDMSVLAERSGVDRFTDIEIANRYLMSVGIDIGSSDRPKKHLYKDMVRNVGLSDFGSAQMFDAKPLGVKQINQMNEDDMEAAARKVAANLIDTGVISTEVSDPKNKRTPEEQAEKDRIKKEEQDAAIRAMMGV